jgi:DNA modification methylase
MKSKTEFPDYKKLSVADLVPYARNSRTHSPQQVDKIAASIREFGFLNPIIVDGLNGIVAGHGRVLAAQKLGLSELPVIDASHLSEAQKRAYVIADNRLALDAGWDNEMLKIELQDLEADGFDLSLTGFELDEIGDLLAEPITGLTDEDAVPEVPAVPVTVEGDVWVLGRHRIACGSSTDEHTVTKVLNGVKPHLMVTDPPYGVEYDADWRNKATRPNGASVGGRATGKVLNDDKADWREAWALFPGDVAYVWHAGLFAGVVADSLISCDFKMRSQIIWAKSNFAIGRGDYHWHHEPCWYAVRGGKTGHYAGDRKQTTLWQIAKPAKSETGHSTQKPVECMRKPIENNSSQGQAVYEPFSGSGTTIIAAEQTGRCCYAVELNPAYVDVAVKRWQDFTGQEATLDGTDETFAALTSKRIAA